MYKMHEYAATQNSNRDLSMSETSNANVFIQKNIVDITHSLAANVIYFDCLFIESFATRKSDLN